MEHPDHARSQQGRHQRQLREAAHHLELPSLTEVLTIEQFGSPRSYNLNDGLEPESAVRCPLCERSVVRLQLDLAAVDLEHLEAMSSPMIRWRLLADAAGWS
jgi:hypothetical protein